MNPSSALVLKIVLLTAQLALIVVTTVLLFMALVYTALAFYDLPRLWFFGFATAAVAAVAAYVIASSFHNMTKPSYRTFARNLAIIGLPLVAAQLIYLAAGSP